MSQSAPILSPLGQAALSYARRGWPVFPCRERDFDLTKGNGETITLKAKAPYGGSGVKDATRDEEVIKAWWRRWPDAMIGLAMGHNGLFALDFDPRTDDETGEVFTLETLKAALVEQMGCDLPRSLTAMTQSDGVHVYLLQPQDGGEPIRNRGNLPRHVDVRGLGGYVIAPPSILYRADGSEGRYSWLSNRHDDPAEAPAALVEILRSRARKTRADTDRPPARSSGAAEPVAPSGKPADVGQAEYDAIRKYGLSALDAECRAVRSAKTGSRNDQLNESALKIASLTVSTPFPALDARFARSAIEAAARDNPGDDDDRQLDATINSGWTAGEDTPRDLTDIATRARQRAARPHRSPRSSASAPPPSTDYGEPSSQAGGEGGIACAKGAGAAADEAVTLECARYPMTDLGNLERFMARCGHDFLCVAAWAESSSSPGYIAWDGTRWNRSMADALFGIAAQKMVRSIQDEADLIRASGVPFPPEEGDIPEHEDDRPEDAEDEAAQSDPGWAEKQFIKAEEKRQARRSAMWYLQRSLARKNRHDGPRHDYIVQVKSNGDIVLFSDKLAAWGRTSESSGHIECLRKLAPPRLSARPEEFDADPLALNVQNGTLVFHRPDVGPDGRNLPARVELREHRRDDRITKIARAAYEPGAPCPQFDGFLTQVQPAADMREWLMRWSGYNALGIADAQVMALFYGEGSNGKGVWVQTHAHILGDYAWATGIETFMDSGFKRNGGGPSPHLAALAGRRMVYANEPEDNSKFSDGLVKSLTSDEPIGGVRELYGPAFELLITFTNTVMANNLPRIGTDFGIRRRMQVVPWTIIIAKEDQDPLLKAKLRAEMSGILNRMIEGALAYLTDGLTMPDAMVEATQAYHEDNDLLGQFLTKCVAREPGSTVGSTPLHDLFVAWQTWSENLPQNGNSWSKKKLRAEMERKSFKIAKSSSMKWHDIVLRYDPIDFVEDGKTVQRDLPPPRHPDMPSAGAPLGAPASPPVAEAPPVPPSPLPPTTFDDDDLPP
ncbi:phage/plasmid primase, P4 family [Sphingobium sp. C100]|uniref:phage/plasmid primase, P4 family n=1 Tax=Sphingobium sp. C100 TaxID=1207055 RepID=UPI0004135E85|nr:phage/plasmid primase, P4 family [Sphingobium sp. C100]